MDRSEVRELHYIAPIANLKSIMEDGILCHNKAKEKHPTSIAAEAIQERRKKVVVPGRKRKLHDYTNLYFNARNAMMSKRRDLHKSLCVLQISNSILDEQDVVLSDMNASSDYVRFHQSPQGLVFLDSSLIYADDWRHPNAIEYYRRRSSVMAEVLVPRCVNPRFIIGVYVSCEETRNKVAEILSGSSLATQITVNGNLFFQEVQDG